MGVQASDLVMVERGGAAHRTTAGAVAGLGGTGGGGGGSSIVAQVNFGAAGDYAEATVAADWALGSLRYLVTPAIPTTADHDPEDALIEGLTGAVVAVEDGVGLTIGVAAPFGSWGRYDFNVMGMA